MPDYKYWVLKYDIMKLHCNLIEQEYNLERLKDFFIEFNDYSRALKECKIQILEAEIKMIKLDIAEKQKELEKV